MHFVMHQNTRLCILKHRLQFSQCQPKVQWHENQAQAGASHQSDQLQFVVQAQPSHTLANFQTMGALKVPRHALHTSPKFGKVKIFSLTWHAKLKRQLFRLTFG